MKLTDKEFHQLKENVQKSPKKYIEEFLALYEETDMVDNLIGIVFGNFTNKFVQIVHDTTIGCSKIDPLQLLTSAHLALDEVSSDLKNTISKAIEELKEKNSSH